MTRLLDRHFNLFAGFLSFVQRCTRLSIKSIHMFAQLRKSATVTEKLKPMIEGPNLPLEVIEPLRIGTKNFLNALVA
jgi:hypothetical protein